MPDSGRLRALLTLGLLAVLGLEFASILGKSGGVRVVGLAGARQGARGGAELAQGDLDAFLMEMTADDVARGVVALLRSAEAPRPETDGLVRLADQARLGAGRRLVLSERRAALRQARSALVADGVALLETLE
jgi:hypothetical protein